MLRILLWKSLELDQSGPRSRCHCLPVSQHCLPGSRVTRMISHILISHFYGRFQISLDFLRFGPEWFQAQMSMSPCPRSRFYFLSLSLFAVSKSWENDLFCMISFKRISSFLFSCVSEFPSLGQEWSQVQLSVSSSQPTTASSIQCRPRCHVCILELFIQLPCLNILDIGAKHDTRKVS